MIWPPYPKIFESPCNILPVMLKVRCRYFSALWSNCPGFSPLLTFSLLLLDTWLCFLHVNVSCVCLSYWTIQWVDIPSLLIGSSQELDSVPFYVLFLLWACLARTPDPFWASLSPSQVDSSRNRTYGQVSYCLFGVIKMTILFPFNIKASMQVKWI